MDASKYVSVGASEDGPTAVAARNSQLPNSPEELSDCILEGAGNTLKLKDQMMTDFFWQSMLYIMDIDGCC